MTDLDREELELMDACERKALFAGILIGASAAAALFLILHLIQTHFTGS